MMKCEMMHGEMMENKRTGEVLGRQVDYTCNKDKF